MIKRVGMRSIFGMGIAAAALAVFATTQLSGCAGVKLPPITVAIDVVEGVQISALAVASGSADVSVDAVCGQFNESQLEAMVREAAGNLISDMVTVTSIELMATDINSTEGDFNVFNTASLDVLDEDRNETLLLGTAANNAGLGSAFTLALDTPVDLLNDLSESDCGAPTLHLDGAGIFEGEAITFNVRMTLLVYTEFPAQ